MNPLIECCEQNLAKNNQSLFSDEFINVNADVVTYSCMNQCSLCARNNYALFEGELIIAESSEELIEKLKVMILAWQKEMM
ncbi:DUF1450 domain-containing protein [Enterococcus rivorum]|uniref:DUF1450 domain-containing protein n=1 Tax=Enterococcus rivorum TaxID=762845 RepID=A0A1E5KTP3_9ENTE|nr:DUF1450 domain-containing protein [Enterococcus rivorum]MBP2100740.1 uncharacterized protein YuzB (UPF0349 family) [Enterococcus rivorum]OEH81128.1 hypothetical protein BCR26_17530 [Enterococcus rivorum]